MKSPSITAVILFYIVAAAYGQSGSLVLPDIEVWGEDRSVLPGIYEQRLQLKPYLNKNLYLTLYGQKIPSKSYPSQIKDWKNGLNVTAGWGDSGEYILGLTHDLHNRAGWFLNYNAEGVRKNPLMEEYKVSSLFKIRFSGGRQQDRYGYMVRGSGYQNDIGSLKTLYRTGGDAYLALGSFNSEMTGSFAALNDASRGNLNFTMEAPLKTYHHLSADILIEKVEINNRENEETEFKIKYLNEVYRDVAFSAGVGYGNEFLYDIMASAGTGDFSVAGTFQKSRERENFDSLISAYPYFVVDELYEYPVNSRWGLNLKNQMGGSYEAGLGLSRARYEDYLYFFKRDDGKVHIRNFTDKVHISKVDIYFKGDFFKTGYIYRHSDKELPDIYNELYADFTIGLFEGLSLELNLNYADKHEQYLDEIGSRRSTIDPYVNIDAALSYNINADFNIKAGLENILAEDITRTGGYSEENMKFFIMMNFGIGNN